MINVAVVGVTGYTGTELVRLLLTHPDVNIVALTSTSHINKVIADISPHLKRFASISTEEFEPENIARKANLAFTALPHGASMNTVRSLVDRGVKVIDLSADFRFSNLAVYKKWYGPHSEAELNEEAVYGLPELNRNKIKNVRLVGNPGCYPTSVLIPLLPFIKNDLIQADSVVVNSASGVSGAGRSPTDTNIFCIVNENYKAYKVSGHRHLPEIEEILSEAANERIKVLFIPHLLPVNRGILSTITARLKKNLSTPDVHRILADYYSGEPFVRIYSPGQHPDIAGVKGSNFCDIGATVDEGTGHIILLSVIDNLVKGASGQAIQNMNIMYDLPEDRGLKHIPLNI